MTCGKKSAKRALFSFFLAIVIFSPMTVYSEIKENTESAGVASVPDTRQDDTFVEDTAAQTINGEISDSKEGSGSAAAMSSGDSGSTGNAFNQISISNSLFTGAGVSQIPVVVPPGRGGIAPNMALTYVSQQWNGWLGVGWNLDMGAIQRSMRFGVDYNKNDFVATANGSSSDLVARGEWGSNYYGAKIEGAFLKYFFNASTGGWEVTAKNGTKYYYGSSGSSRQNNASVVFKWCLDKVQDLNGNYMTVSYVKDLGEIYLSRIDYTGNQGLPTTNYVVFYSELRSDSPDMYVPNFLVRTRYRLKAVEVRSGGQIARIYQMIYGTSGSTSRSILTSVRQYGSDSSVDGSGNVTGGSVLPATSLGYTTSDNALSAPTQWLSASGPGGPTYNAGYQFTGDFNGDGKIDYMYYRNGWYVALSNGVNGFNPPTQWLSASGPSGPTYNAGFQYTGDFNGDGKIDYMYYRGAWYVALSNGTTFNDPTLWLSASGPGGPTYNAGFQYTGDFNGDGKIDYMYYRNGWYVALANAIGNGFNPPTQWLSASGPSGPTYNAGYQFTGDYNGDGKIDYMYHRNGWYVALANAIGNGFNPPTLWLSGSGPSGPTYNAGFMYTGDFNGDGKIDYMYHYNGWYVALSNGNNFNAPTQWLSASGPSGPTYNASFQFTGDFNGDGKIDYMYNYNGWYVALSIGNSFNPPTQWLSNSGPSGQTYNIGYQYVGDFNGDGKTDYMYMYGGWYVAESHEQADLLSSVSNGNGGITSIEYKPSTEYVNTLLPFPVQVVHSITTNDNNGNNPTRSYAYSNGYYDIKERDFRGFGYVNQVNPDQTTVESGFLQDNVFKGMMSHQTVTDSGGNNYTQTYNTYASASPYGGSVFPFLRQTDGYLYDGTPNYKNVRTWFEYDGYGNRTRAYSYGDVSIAGDERDDRVEYVYDTTRWIVSQPSHTYSMDIYGVIKAQSWFVYNAANGNLLSKTDWLENGINPVTQYTYNSYGNQTTTTDPKNNVTTTSYDSTYTYPTTVTNQYFGFSSSKTYDSRYGKPLTETDINGNTTTYQYDVFGRPKKMTNPYDNTSAEGTRSVYYENFGLGAGYQRVATHSTEISGTGSYIWQENYFDGFGRTIGTRREGPDGKVIAAETNYDAMGRVSFSSLPYFEGLETARWVAYLYDPMGRVTRVTNPDGTFVTRSYTLGTTASVDANGHKREEDRDAYGRLAKVREYTGTSPNFTLYATTAYRYDTLGNLTRVTDAAGNVTDIGYDTLSRKISMIDPDMGYWTYQYDANGNLTSQTDARNDTIAFSYDALNRLTNKQYPAGPDVLYTYDETFSTNPKGRLTTVGDLSGTTKFYYDKLGRVTSSVKNVDGVDYTTDTTYDALGRTASITYPDAGREIVSYTYDTGGNLRFVTGAAVYAQYSSYNALGQAGVAVLGNNSVTTQYTYSPTNNRLSSITTNSQAQGGLQNLSYTYDNVGNIQTITDLLDATRTQGFLYDGLNRIAQAQSTAYGTLTYNFDAIGNMTYNSQVGNYTYLPAKPHAVVTAGANSYTYDPNGNMMGRNGATLTHDYENRLVSLVAGGTTTTFVYDFSGGRVKKTSSSITTLYIDKLYECTSGVCTSHIFAGGNRIVSKKPTGTYYYHTA